MELRRVLLTEVSGLLTIVRCEPAWVSQSASEHAKTTIVGLQRLRQTLLDQAPERAPVSQRDLLSPLLEVVQCEALSAPFTNLALDVLHKVLMLGLIDSSQAGARDAMDALVAAVTQCRFESVDSESDELVIAAVFQVILSALHNAHALLNDDAVGRIVEACVALNGHNVKLSEQLRGLAEQTLLNVVHAVFRQLHSIDLGIMSEAEPNSVSEVECGEAAKPLAEPGTEAKGTRDTASDRSLQSFGLPCMVDLLQRLSDRIEFPLMQPTEHTSDNDADDLTEAAFTSHVLCARALVLTVAEASNDLARTPTLLRVVQDNVCGAIVRMLQVGAAHVLTPAGSGAEDPPAVRGDAVAAAERLPSDFELLSLGLELVRTLWGAPTLRKPLMLQFDVFFTNLFLPALRRPREHLTGFAYIEWRAILECLQAILSEPGALVDLYMVFDCDATRTDVLENLYKTLSAATANLQKLSDLRTTEASPQGGSDGMQRFDLASLLHSPEPEDMTLMCVIAGLNSLQEAKHFPHSSLSSLSAHELSRVKYKKRALCQGAALFSQKPRKGLRELQRLNVMPTPLEPAAVVEFLHTLPPGLTKEAVGSYLGEQGVLEDKITADTFVGDTASFHADVLIRFARCFDFSGLSLLASLRTFLTSFRLPGEAQQIDRILVAFADRAFEQCEERELLASTDVAYVLSFSIIMLQTDLHNKHIKEESKMSFDDYYRNNKNYGFEVSKGNDLPRDLLLNIYESVRDSPFELKSDGGSDKITPEGWTEMLRCSDAVRRASNSLNTLPVLPRQEAKIAVPEGSDVGTLHFVPQVFALLWSPALAALSACLLPPRSTSTSGESAKPAKPSEVASAESLGPMTGELKTTHIELVRTGFICCAQLSSRFGLHGILDQIVIALCNFSQLLSPVKSAPPEPEWEVPAGEKTRAAFCTPSSQLSCQLALEIAHMFGNDVHNGWQPVVACISRLYELGMLPDALQSASRSNLLPPSECEQMHERIRLAMSGEQTQIMRDQSDGEHTQNTSGGGVLGWFFGGSGGTNEPRSENDTDDEDEHEILEDEFDAEGMDVATTASGSDEHDATIISTSAACVALKSSHVLDLSGDTKFYEQARLVALLELLVAGAEQRGWKDTAAQGQLEEPDTPDANIENKIGDKTAGESSGTSAAAQLGVEGWSTAAGGGWPPLPLPASTANSAVLCERLLIEVGLSNRFRINEMWPLLHAHFERMLLQMSHASFVGEEAISGLLQLLIRLWSREALSEALTQSLQLLNAVRPEVWNIMAPLIVCGVSQLAQAHSASFSGSTWEVVFQIITQSAKHSASHRHGLQALRWAVNDPSCNCVASILCTSLFEFVSCRVHGEEQSVSALKLLWGVHASANSEDAILAVIRCIAKCCQDTRPDVQSSSHLLLQSVLLDSRANVLKPTSWNMVFDSVLFPLLSGIAGMHKGESETKAASPANSELPIALGKIFALRAGNLVRLPRFHETWVAYLKLLENFANMNTVVTPQSGVVSEFRLSMDRMRQLGAFQAGDDTAGKEMEDLTWAIIGEMRADICEEFRRAGNVKHVSDSR